MDLLTQLIRQDACLITHCKAVAPSLPDLSPTKGCVQACRSKCLGCPAGHQEINKCHTRGKTEETKHTNEDIHPGFGTKGSHHQKLKPDGTVAPQKKLMSAEIFKPPPPKSVYIARSILIDPDCKAAD